MRVEEAMTRSVLSVSSGRSVLHASELMEKHRIGSLLVIDSGAVVGILTSRDVRSAHPNRIVADAMTAEPIRIPADAFVWDALRVMERHGIERLLVRAGAGEDPPAGIVTREALASRLSEWIDSMTGLYKAPYIEAIATDLLGRGETFHLLFIDLNDFGAINKRFGHPVGDDLIRGFASKLKSVFAEDDCLCRYAGDEFVALTRRPASFVREAIDELTAGFATGPAVVSASVGWFDAGQEPGKTDGLSFRELILRASLMSTEAKAAGR